jgi:hypothetical protein
MLQARHSQRHGEVEGDLGNDCKIYHSHTVKFELIFGSAGGLLLELSALNLMSQIEASRQYQWIEIDQSEPA